MNRLESSLEKTVRILVLSLREDIQKNCIKSENGTIGGGGSQKNY